MALPAVPGAKNYTDITTIFNDSALKAKLQIFLDEAVKAKGQIKQMQQDLKDIREQACEELQINGKLFNAMASMLYNNDMHDRLEDLNQLENAINGLLQVAGD
jgi:hypothetical protein